MVERDLGLRIRARRPRRNAAQDRWKPPETVAHCRAAVAQPYDLAVASKYVFGDEAGNFDFTTGRKASRYFVITTVAMDCFRPETNFSRRRDLAAWGKKTLPSAGDRRAHSARTLHAYGRPSAGAEQPFRRV